MSTAQDIAKVICSRPRGTLFVPKDFLRYGSRDAIDQALSRLTQKGQVRRVYRGIYDRPIAHPLLGALAPDPVDIVSAVARQNGYTLQVSGASAANSLGLSQQIPAKLVFYTDGPTRTIRYNNTTILLRHTSPRKLMGAGKIHGAIIQAIHHYGPKRFGVRKIQHLAKQLSTKDKKNLLVMAVKQPAWVHKLLTQIATYEE